MLRRRWYDSLQFPTNQWDYLNDRAGQALGATYEGYKGGDFVMGGDTPLWRAAYGCTGDAIVSADFEGSDLVLTCKTVDV